jgi:hypothetical protein
VRWTSDLRTSGRKPSPAFGLAGARATEGGELRPVAGIDFEGGAKAGDDAAAVREEADELKIGERRDGVDGGAELRAERGDERGVRGGFARDRLGGAGERETGAREWVWGGGLGLDEEDAGARNGAEVARVDGEAADVDHKGAVGIEEGGGDRGVGFTFGGGGREMDGGERRAEAGGEGGGASEGFGHNGTVAKAGWGGQG